MLPYAGKQHPTLRFGRCCPKACGGSGGAGGGARRGCWWRLYDLPTRRRARVLSGCPKTYRIFCGAGLSARRGCWWRLYDLPTRRRARVLSGCPKTYRIFGGAGLSARRGCWWRLRGSFGPGDDAGDLAGFVPVEVDEVAELMSVGLPFRARVASRRSSRMRRWWPRRRRGRYRPGLSVMRV